MNPALFAANHVLGIFWWFLGHSRLLFGNMIFHYQIENPDACDEENRS